MDEKQAKMMDVLWMKHKRAQRTTKWTRTTKKSKEQRQWAQTYTDKRQWSTIVEDKIDNELQITSFFLLFREDLNFLAAFVRYNNISHWSKAMVNRRS